jgi:hypothetical protein
MTPLETIVDVIRTDPLAQLWPSNAILILAQHVLDAMQPIITTADALDALPTPTLDSLGGVLIKAQGYPSFGDVYERNTDGTWGLLETPGGGDLDQRRVTSFDIALPAIVLWNPAP